MVELIDLFLQIAQADAVLEKVSEDDGKRKEREEERHTHVGGHGETALRLRIRSADHHWVDGAEQADG